MNMTESYGRLMESLNDLRRQWRMHQVIEGALLALTGAVAILVAVVAADNLFHLDTVGRALLALSLWAVLLAAVLGLVVRRVLEDRRDDFFAVLVEQKHPELRNQLINALQLGRGVQNGFSQGLIEAIVHDAAHSTSDIEMTESVDSKPTRRAALIALVALLVIGGYAGAMTARFSNGLGRVLLPWADIPPYTATQVAKVLPGDTRIPEGVSLTVEAKVAGAIPASAQLVRFDSAEHKQAVAMQPDAAASDPVFRFTVLQANESFDYLVTAGDGRSRRYHVEVVKRPQVETLTLSYQLPEYTGRPEKRVDNATGDIAGLIGTRVQFEMKATKPLREATFLTEKGDLLTLERKDDRTWSTSFVLWSKDVKANADAKPLAALDAPTRYQLKLLDTEGFENADPLWKTIAVTRDQAPTVAIVNPGRDLQAKPDAVLPLTVIAKDDHGLGEIRILYRVNDESSVRELKKFPFTGAPELQTSQQFDWNLAKTGLKNGDVVQYWASAVDRNNLTGPGQANSRQFSLFLVKPEDTIAQMENKIFDYAKELERLLQMQRKNRADTYSGIAFPEVIKRQVDIRTDTRKLARVMDQDALPVKTIVKSLDGLFTGLMAEAVKLLEQGRDAGNPDKASTLRAESLPVQDKIIAELEALLARLQRNEQARNELKKIEKKDAAAHLKITNALGEMIKDLNSLLKDQTELASKFEKLPKKPVEELKEEEIKAVKDLEAFKEKANQWSKGKVNELTKLPTGFVDDFKLRPDVNKIFEEIEKALNRSKAEKIEVSLEDLGAGLATRMKEDLEMWMPDSPDAVKWVHEEPLDKKGMKVPEMPLPSALEDLVGDLLQKAEEFDEEADDVTSAWGDNLDQAGWGVADGPISSFSAKGKTGNDLPNNQEVTGRSGEGRRGKSTGQMVGDTSSGLQGRKTPARMTNERYEPGQLKQKGRDDPNGSTGGGKVSGGGKKGLQGGSPPPLDLKRDLGRLEAKQAGLREQAEQVAKKLDTMGIGSKRLNESIDLMKQSEKDLRDLRYDDAARKRKVALTKLNAAFDNMDEATAAQLSRARDLPPHLRKELLQSADEGYPAGYESLLKSYFKALSVSEK